MNKSIEQEKDAVFSIEFGYNLDEFLNKRQINKWQINKIQFQIDDPIKIDTLLCAYLALNYQLFDNNLLEEIKEKAKTAEEGYVYGLIGEKLNEELKKEAKRLITFGKLMDKDDNEKQLSELVENENVIDNVKFIKAFAKRIENTASIYAERGTELLEIYKAYTFSFYAELELVGYAYLHKHKRARQVIVRYDSGKDFTWFEMYSPDVLPNEKMKKLSDVKNFISIKGKILDDNIGIV